MKLTTKQIEQIETKLLNDYRFHYDDTKHEIIDHIASEIESREENETFNMAFEKAFNQWKHKLEETEWSGMHLYGNIKAPMFYKQRLLKSFRTDLIYFVLTVMFFPLGLYFFQDSMTIDTLNNTALAYKMIIFCIAFSLNYYCIKKYKNGAYTTVYGQIAAYANNKILKALPISAIFLIFLNTNSLQYRDNINLWLGSLLFVNAFYFLYIIKCANYFRHLSIVKKINKWNIA